MSSSIWPTSELRSNPPLPTSALSPQELFNSIKKTILDSSESADLSYESIPPPAGLQLATSFREDPDIEGALPRSVFAFTTTISSNFVSYNSHTQTLTVRVKPTRVHDAHQPWLDHEMLDMVVSGFLSVAEKKFLKRLVGTTFQGFVASYEASSKEPDTCILPDAQPLPTVVFETGWSESWPRLDHDKDLWLLGGAPTVQLVFLIKWSKSDGNRVKGEIQVYGRDGTGEPTLLQIEPIFPVPLGDPDQTLPITRAQLFGASVFPGRSPTDTYNLSIANLRANADPFIRNMGFIPA
ncbi:hypothetical protein AJ78_07733 [Emergomyces pasteurianus Ep9510]|uniref:Uncharacterized protein n=1 Tax=Emergomyces pasteurianus Ep9510 TaxID=1447872 RepID=A0A1J9Q5I8_9EURO|nr:hypothetical protein AJ78_07733 [Emergomyces pasteurianus Ep9510]